MSDESAIAGGAGLIDVHQHAMPPAVKKLLVDRGILPPVGGPPFANWDLASALDTMDATGIAVGLLSAAIPSEFLGPDETFAATLTRTANESIAEVVREHPTRFGLLAYLPLGYTDAALAEVEYAFDELGADGVIVGSHNGEAYLGDPSFEKVFAELDRRGAVVLTHPFNLPSCAATPLPPFLSDFMLDTTRAAIQLVTSGTLERYPAISVILPHGGGFLPYQAARLTLGSFLGFGLDPQGVARALALFHYDTAGPMSPYATPSLLAAAGASRIVFGSDYNAVPVPGIVANVGALRADPALDADALARIGRGNALRLFPTLASRLERASR
jgi:predicted TIM-barrel fold metal-dependent hydrolase